MSFHDVRFPLDISYGSSGGPEYSTDVVTTLSGAEYRNRNWSQARTRYNVAYGVRSEAQLEALLTFFRARQGRAFAFRFKDWGDYLSCPAGNLPAATDQPLGTGNSAATQFQLQKTYISGPVSTVRPITHVVASTVKVALGGAAQAGGWSINLTTGLLTFSAPPAAGVAITAGFEFDVPVRFDTDYLPLSLDTYGVGSARDVPLVEVR
jgi:uncharacterized protein (TIGR02217 family)